MMLTGAPSCGWMAIPRLPIITATYYMSPLTPDKLHVQKAAIANNGPGRTSSAVWWVGGKKMKKKETWSNGSVTPGTVATQASVRSGTCSEYCSHHHLITLHHTGESF